MANAVDFMVLTEMSEKLGGTKEIREMLNEIEPPKRDLKKVARRAVFFTTILFWMAATEPMWEIDAEIAYPLALANIFAVKRFLYAAV